MKRKDYIAPNIQVVVLEHNSNLLAGSPNGLQMYSVDAGDEEYDL